MSNRPTGSSPQVSPGALQLLQAELVLVQPSVSCLSSQGDSYSGFLWDSLSGVDLKDAAVLEPAVANGNSHASPLGLYLAHFSVSSAPTVRPEAPLALTRLSLQMGSLELAVLNVHLQAFPAQRPHLSHSIQEALRGAFPRRPSLAGAALTLWLLLSAGEKELVVLGDFGCPPHSSELDILRKDKFCPLVPPTQFTNISTRSPQGSRCLDNIWMSRSLRKLFSGKRILPA